jgi:hypothetical protein
MTSRLSRYVGRETSQRCSSLRGTNPAGPRDCERCRRPNLGAGVASRIGLSPRVRRPDRIGELMPVPARNTWWQLAGGQPYEPVAESAITAVRR